MRSALFQPLKLALAAGLALFAAACSKGDDGAAADANVKLNPFLADVVMGQDAAPVTIVEYASLLCPLCRDFWKQEMPQLKEKYIDTGKVKYILRDLPTHAPEVAQAGAAIARCAGKDKFYDVVDDFYSTYAKLDDALAGAAGAAPLLVEIGGRHGLSRDQVRACVNDPAANAYIKKETTDRPSFVTGTPTLTLDGQLVENHSFANLSKLIDAKLGVAPAPAPAGAAPSTAITPAPSSATTPVPAQAPATAPATAPAPAPAPAPTPATPAAPVTPKKPS